MSEIVAPRTESADKFCPEEKRVDKYRYETALPKKTVQYCTHIQWNNGPWSWYYRHHVYMSTIPICPSPSIAYHPLFHPIIPPSFHTCSSHYPRLSSSSPTSPPFPPHPLLPSPYVLPLLHLSPPISPSMCPPPPQVIIKSTPLSMATNQHTSHQGSLGWNGTNLILMIDMCPS